ncbi:MAG: hypothetical protein WCC60_14975 [Ilumatobacteraceae bacterium]
MTFIDTPVAEVGIVQLPLLPHTNGAYVSPAAIGDERGPTAAPVRVSIRRHGVIGTNTELTPPVEADDVNTPPVATDSATTDNTDANRDRCGTLTLVLAFMATTPFHRSRSGSLRRE